MKLQISGKFMANEDVAVFNRSSGPAALLHSREKVQSWRVTDPL
jgi:hypothetical protein